MFSENDRISQRQMERQIVLVLLCPAFWQLAAYGASDGLPGMAGIFVGYGLLAVWCIYLVRLGGLYCRLESVMGKAGKLLLAVMYLCYLLFLGGTLLRRMAELAAAYLTAGVPQELCGLFLLAAAGFGVGSEVQKRGRLAEALYPWIVGGILILLLLTVPQMHFPRLRMPGRQQSLLKLWITEYFLGGMCGEHWKWNTDCAAAVFTGACAERAQECHSSGDAEYLENGASCNCRKHGAARRFRPARHGCGAGPALTVNGRNEPAGWISGAV